MFMMLIFLHFIVEPIPLIRLRRRLNKKKLKAMIKEIDLLNKNETLQFLDGVENKKDLDVKWVYSKILDTYKAELVVRSFQQTDKIDDIYSPVAKM